MSVIQKDMLIGEILDIDESLGEVLLEIGMHCLGCPASQGETLEQACAVHGVDADEIMQKLNDKINIEEK